MRQSKSKSKECFDIHAVARPESYPKTIFIFVQDDYCSFFERGRLLRGEELTTDHLSWQRDSDVGTYVCTTTSVKALQQSHPELFI